MGQFHTRLSIEYGTRVVGGVAPGKGGQTIDGVPVFDTVRAAVAESGAIGKPDPVNMEVVKAFVALKPGNSPSEDLELSIMNFIRKKLSPLAMPQEIEFVDKLPKTRSGKIMRRLLKAQELGEELGDTSTLEND